MRDLIYPESQRTAELINNRRGMSIVGVLVAAGMMGGLALFLADMTKRQHESQKKAESGAEAVSLQQTVSSLLNDGKACGETLKGANISGIPSSGTPVAGIKNRSGTVVVNSGKINNLLEVSFTLKNPNIPSGTGTRTGNVEIEMVIKKLSRAVVMGKTVAKSIPLTVEVDASGNLLGCSSTLDSQALNIKLAVKKDMCTEIGGIWNISGKSCSITNLFEKNCQGMGGTWDTANKKCLVTNLFEKNCQGMGGTWDTANKKCLIDNLLKPLKDMITSHSNSPHNQGGSTSTQTGSPKAWGARDVIIGNLPSTGSSWKKVSQLRCPLSPKNEYECKFQSIGAKKELCRSHQYKSQCGKNECMKTGWSLILGSCNHWKKGKLISCSKILRRGCNGSYQGTWVMSVCKCL